MKTQTTRFLILLCLMLGYTLATNAQTAAPNPSPVLSADRVFPVYGYYGGTGNYTSVNTGTTVSKDGPGESIKAITGTGGTYSQFRINAFGGVPNIEAQYGYTKLHFQWYATAGQKLKVTWENSSWVAINNYTYTAAATGWNSVEIDLTGSDNIVLLKLDLPYSSTTSYTLYFDNFYFSRPEENIPPADPAPTTMQEPDYMEGTMLYPLYTDAENNLNLSAYSNWNSATMEETAILTKNALKVKWQAPAGNKYGAAVIIPINDDKVLTETVLNEYARIRFDVWYPTTVSDAVFALKLQGGTSNDNLDGAVNVSGLTDGVWKTFDVPLSTFGVTDATKLPVKRILLQSSTSTPEIFYIDNIVLYTHPTPETLIEPTRSDIYSFYSDNADGKKIGTTTRWGAYTMSEYTSSSNKTAYQIKSDAGVAAYDAGFRFNFSAANQVPISELMNEYNKVHVDVWSSVATADKALRVHLYGTEAIGEKNMDKIPTAKTWQSYDYNLTDFASSSEDKNKVLTGIQFTNGLTTTRSMIYVDNIYLYYDVPASPTPSLNNELVVWTGETSVPGTWTGGAQKASNDNIYEEVALTSGATYTATSVQSLDGRNMLYLDVYSKGITPSAFTITLSDGTNTATLTETADSFGAHSWTSLNIPLEEFAGISNLSSIKSIAFTGTGTVGIDNIIFYEKDNPYPVALINGVEYYSIMLAVAAAKTMTGDVEVKIIRSSNESQSIFIDSKENVSWNSLTIYPSGDLDSEAKTITHTAAVGSSNRSLFVFASGAKNVTITGKLNNADTGDSKKIILQGKNLKNDNGGNNSVVYIPTVENVTIADCIFQGQSPENRPVSTIQGRGRNIIIKDNYFEDCLYLDYKAVGDSTSLTVISIDKSNNEYVSTNIEISGNHFYETQPIDYKSKVFRSFIKIHAPSNVTTYQTPIKILNNKIGGSGPDVAGTMSIGHGDNSQQGVIWAIAILNGWPNGSVDVDNTSNYILVQGNEIANIDMLNRAPGVYNTTGNSAVLEPDYFGAFSGIYFEDGLVIAKDNRIHDISIKSAAAETGTQRYLFTGIRAGISGGNGRFIIEGNELYNLYADYTADQSAKSSIIMGIFGQISNASAGIIRDNYVVTGHTGTKKMNFYADISGISARISSVSAGNKARLDVYNNVAVLNEFKLTSMALRAMSAMNLMNNATSADGVINCYNNLVYVQPKEANSFQGIQTRIAGITCITNTVDGLYNIFHNTILVAKDAKLEAMTNAPAAFIYEFGAVGVGTLNIWNNNFVNLNSNGAVYQTNRTAPKSIYFDYNNYYVPEGGNIVQVNNTPLIKTFDNWKFSNLLSYLDKTTEHDHHSRFLYPSFNSTVSPDAWTNISMTIDNVKLLKTQLVPARFIAGKKADLSNFKTVTLTINDSDVAAVSTATMTDDTNNDAADTPAKRRAYLPTIGALNTSFSNYYLGGTWDATSSWGDGIVPGTSNTTPWYQDLVFAEAATANLTLNEDMAIHDFYNDTQRQLMVNGNKLTITGYIGIENKKQTLNLAQLKSTIVLAGNDGHDVTYNGITRKSAAAQHIFVGTFAGNFVTNLSLSNQSQYFTLLHASFDEPSASPTLNISNDFSILSPNNDEITYPNNEKGKHLGGLNCIWYKTNLGYNGTNASTNEPNLSVANTTTDDYTYRPYTGQRIPRHGIFNDSIYNLDANSTKLVSYHDFLFINNLNIRSGKNIEIAADKFVQIQGTVLNSAGNTGLIIKSREATDEAETALKAYLFPNNPRPNATFIYNPDNNNNNIPATVEMYSPAKYAESTWVSPAGNTYEARWQYFTAAVGNQAASSSGSTIYKYYPQGNNNPEGLPGQGSPYWTITSSENFAPGDGYCIYYKTPKVYPWKGNLTNAAVSKTLTVYPFAPIPGWTDLEDASGKHLIGNPYTASVDIKSMSFGDGLNKTIYIYNTGTTAEYMNENTTNEGGFYSNNPGTVIVIPQNLAGTTVAGGKLPQYIPSMQAFTVVANSNTDNTFSFNYAGVSKNVESMRSPSKTGGIDSHVVVELKQDGYSNKALLAIHPDCSKGFDNGWDGIITGVDTTLPLAVFMVDKESEEELDKSCYQISVMDDYNETYLGIVVGNRSPEGNGQNDLVEYELVFNHENVDATLYLEDLLLEEITDISESGTSYKFFEANSGEIQTRFRIFIQAEPEPETPTSVENPTKEEIFTIYTHGNTIYISNNGEAAAQVSVYDITGKCILMQDVAGNANVKLNVGLVPGIYIVKAITANNQVNKSVIIN